MSTPAKYRTTKKASAARAMRNIALAITFAVIEVLAALQLDGWLSVALWAVAAWNVILAVAIMVGLAIIASQALNEDGAR